MGSYNFTAIMQRRKNTGDVLLCKLFTSFDLVSESWVYTSWPRIGISTENLTKQIFKLTFSRFFTKRTKLALLIV